MDRFYKLCFMMVYVVMSMSVLCSHVVTYWERADLLAVLCDVFCHFPPHQKQG